MTPSDLALFTAVALIGLNQLLVRVPGWLDRAWLFWGVQFLDLAAGTALLAGWTPSLGPRAVEVVLGLLFLFHVIANNHRLVAQRAERRRADADEERRRRIREALARGEGGGGRDG